MHQAFVTRYAAATSTSILEHSLRNNLSRKLRARWLCFTFKTIPKLECRQWLVLDRAVMLCA